MAEQLRRFLRMKEIEKMVGLKKSQIYLLIAQGKFPRLIKLTDHASAGIEDEIVAWQTARIAASRDDEVV